jgi:signal transduction histidine kinase
MPESTVLLLEPEYYVYLLYLFTIIVTILMISQGYLLIAKRRAKEKEAESLAYSKEAAAVQEQERERISRELHDTVIQDMRCVSLGIDNICLTKDEKEREKIRKETLALQSGLSARLRDICWYLVPPDFRQQGIGGALRTLCHNFGEKTGLECPVYIKESPALDNMDTEKQLQIYRIVQEALTNVEKHAQAKKAIVSVQVGPEIHIGITDDGKGFNPPGNSPVTQGIRGMKNRTAILGGTLEIVSEPGQGTTIQVRVPKETRVPKVYNAESVVN